MVLDLMREKAPMHKWKCRMAFKTSIFRFGAVASRESQLTGVVKNSTSSCVAFFTVVDTRVQFY